MVKMWNVWITKRDLKTLLKLVNESKNKSQGSYIYDDNKTYIEYEIDNVHDVIIKKIE